MQDLWLTKRYSDDPQPNKASNMWKGAEAAFLTFILENRKQFRNTAYWRQLLNGEQFIS